MHYLLKAPILTSLTLGLGLGACATVQPPPTLVDARAAYSSAESGRAGQAAPDELYESKKSLARAEASFTEDGDSWETRTYAYIALRKAERAKIIAEERDMLATLELREENKDELAERLRRDATRQLGDVKEELQDERAKRAAAEAGRVQAEVDAVVATAKLRVSTEKLKQVAQVAENERGMVIALSAGVIFASGSSTLRAAAFPKLDLVAEVLKEQPARQVMIEGHTDADGPDAANLMLSTARAQSVRSYLVSRGVDPARMAAIGLGESRPVTENTSVEGKANNRRVEIILAPAAKSD